MTDLQKVTVKVCLKQITTFKQMLFSKVIVCCPNKSNRMDRKHTFYSNDVLWMYNIVWVNILPNMYIVDQIWRAKRLENWLRHGTATTKVSVCGALNWNAYDASVMGVVHRTNCLQGQFFDYQNYARILYWGFKMCTNMRETLKTTVTDHRYRSWGRSISLVLAYSPAEFKGTDNKGNKKMSSCSESYHIQEVGQEKQHTEHQSMGANVSDNGRSTRTTFSTLYPKGAQ